MLTQERSSRMIGLIASAHRALDEAIESEIVLQDKQLAGICCLYSGGGDSTVLAHLFSNSLTHFIHCNTGIGVEQTREFVRDTASSWRIPLIEPVATGANSYTSLIMGDSEWKGGFPGPASHNVMFQRLKERGLRTARNSLVADPRKRRVIFLAGRRSEESARRKFRTGTGELRSVERQGSIVYVSPLLGWTKLDMNAYRMMHPGMPHNEITDLLHMSGECLCGAFAKEHELEQLSSWPQTLPAADSIRRLEAMVRGSGRFPEVRCHWGWGWAKDRPDMVGLLCHSCGAR